MANSNVACMMLQYPQDSRRHLGLLKAEREEYGNDSQCLLMECLNDCVMLNHNAFYIMHIFFFWVGEIQNSKFLSKVD